MRFSVYNAVIFSAFTTGFCVVAATTMWSMGFMFLLFLAMEFFVVLPLYWILLKQVIEFNASRIIAVTSLAGWPLASLLLMCLLWVLPRPYYWYTDLFMLMPAALVSLSHCVDFFLGALIGASIPVSSGERLKRKLVFAIARAGDVVDLLELAASIGEDPLNVREGVLHLLRGGYVEGYLDSSDKLHIGLVRPLTPVFTTPTAERAKGLTREFDVVVGLLVDLEELRERGRVSRSSYRNLREEYERRLRELESATDVTRGY